MTRPLPTDRITPAELPGRIWQELQRATVDRHHEWRTPVLASVDADGLPQARTVVLRRADAEARTLTCFTDARSPKCADLQARPRAALVFWSQRLGWQLRITADARVATDGPAVQAAWERVRPSAAATDYLMPRAPGAPLDTTTTGPAGERHHLAIVQLEVRAIDWLELHRDGHRRGRWDGGPAQGGEPAGWVWLTP
ncbi:pyridoxamine 5'-phosphate oxidase family protein [Hydrogenophaga sp. R2]|uniref:pyridoxamine 5'-phosphate oxidase family protein n=1 Tax=Hydrogenophaga sp. R2 TaxID=3132827 RepID=UPI003CF6EF7F